MLRSVAWLADVWNCVLKPVARRIPPKMTPEIDGPLPAGAVLVTTSLGPLASLGELKVLDLSGTDVADRLEPLAELDALEWAVLRVLSLKEGALAPLADCKSLRRVSLNQSQVSATTIEAFRAQRPDVQLDGPWRAPGSIEDSLPDGPREAAAEGP